MEINKQVCNLELAKRLKELGVKQNSFFRWDDYGEETLILSLQNDEVVWDKNNVSHVTVSEYRGSYSAFTSAELSKMLPRRFETDAKALMMIFLIENKIIDVRQ